MGELISKRSGALSTNQQLNKNVITRITKQFSIRLAGGERGKFQHIKNPQKNESDEREGTD